MLRKILALMLAMLTLVSLFACGNTPAVSEDTTDAPTDPVTTEPVTEAGTIFAEPDGIDPDAQG